MKNKNGLGHVEAILSITIFIGFMFVLLYLVRPFDLPKENNNIDILKVSLPEYLGANLTDVGLNVEVQNFSNANCFALNIDMGNYTRVYASNGSLVASKATQHKLYVKGKTDFYHVYISDEFDDTSMDTNPCVPSNNYRFGSSNKIDILSFKKISALNTSYWEDYEGTKQKLRVLSSSDYGFIIFDSSNRQLVNSFRTPLSSVNLQVDEKAMPMLYKNGTIESVKLRIFTY